MPEFIREKLAIHRHWSSEEWCVSIMFLIWRNYLQAIKVVSTDIHIDGVGAVMLCIQWVRQAMDNLYTPPTIETHSGLKTRSGNQWYSRSMPQMLACWALSLTENQERWWFIASNIITVQCDMGRHKIIFSKYAMALREYLHGAMSGTTRLDLLPLYRTLSAFISSAPSHPLLR